MGLSWMNYVVSEVLLTTNFQSDVGGWGEMDLTENIRSCQLPWQTRTRGENKSWSLIHWALQSDEVPHTQCWPWMNYVVSEALLTTNFQSDVGGWDGVDLTENIRSCQLSWQTRTHGENKRWSLIHRALQSDEIPHTQCWPQSYRSRQHASLFNTDAISWQQTLFEDKIIIWLTDCFFTALRIRIPDSVLLHGRVRENTPWQNFV